MTKLQVAVVGLGTMGAGMARSLLRIGHDVRVWNRTPEGGTAGGSWGDSGD